MSPQPGPSDETHLASGAASGADDSGARRPSSSHSGWLSSSQPSAGRFGTGDVLAERYRIIGLLGRGGMGEVYRADDLRLGQPVALKFLPAGVADDPVRLAQFHNEVRTARQISHRNVCRVYDINEADGRIFLSMEYVDGEDLSVLLRRIGRFPQDKAVEIARQLCAGLAAAHEQGVVHRDLKPANVMLDSEGRVRITDFGLAGLASDVQDVRAGTPAYMAPEQLAGREVSVRSDLFALGLVLFEVFTGKRVFDAKTVAELLRQQDQSVALAGLHTGIELDPAIERVLQRCLARDPLARPASAIAVAAALPGGDPLAAALAAGETPSPEMLVQAGAREALSPRRGLTVVVATILGLLLMTAAAQHASIFQRAPFDKPPDVLIDRAQSHLNALGYRDLPVDTASGFTLRDDYMRYARIRPEASRWRELSTGRTGAALFWYRTSPEALAPEATDMRVGPFAPAVSTSGMTVTIVDPIGRLVEFHAVPPQFEARPSAELPATDWKPLFAAAQLPADRFTAAAPQWTPRDYADQRAAWAGTLPELGDTPVRVEAAAYRGRPVYFEVIYPWTRARRTVGATQSASEQASRAIAVVGQLLVLIWAAFAARRNFLAGRGDAAGARRVAVFVFGVWMVSWVIGAKHVSVAGLEILRFNEFCGFALFLSGSVYVFYLALEPTVRRIWPDGLVGWSRLITGHWRDPLVGRQVLAGVACGVSLSFSILIGFALADYFAGNIGEPWSDPVRVMGSGRTFVSAAISTMFSGVYTGLFIVLLYAAAHRLLRRELLAIPAVIAILALLLSSNFVRGQHLATEITFTIVICALLVLMVRRFGLLSMVVAFSVNALLFGATPLTTNVSVWYAPMALFSLSLVVALALYGYVSSRGGEPLFGRAFAEE